MKYQSSISQILVRGGGTLFSFLLIFLIATNAFASTTDGTIDSTNRYAYSENAGWIDFGTTLGNVHVTASALSGYAYGENIGWISLNCSNTSSCGTVDYKVSNDGTGVLSGYAYGENVGWIHFNPSAGGVSINSSGVFSGSAYGENIGWITFNCSTTSSCGTVSDLVSTDWRPAVSGGGGGSSGGGAAPSSGGGGSLGPNYVFPSNSPGTTTATTTPGAFQPVGCPPNNICTVNTSTNNGNLSSHMKPSEINRNLTLKSQGEDVRVLQQFLNQYGVKLRTTGAGSRGNETTYFGVLTKNALAAYQKLVDIVPSAGYFGPITRAWLRSIGF